MTSPEGGAIDNGNSGAAVTANNNNPLVDNQASLTAAMNHQTTLTEDTASSSSMSPAVLSLPGCARAILSCRPNSHPFQDRTLNLDQSVKVGRSVARARPAQGNAIFDCKVLSRNHALLWYDNGKFYLQDTKSSNGTFVNNQRLSKGSEESLPREVCSGDILQFGVDVMENSRKVTHGCIIATLKLLLPDGKEAKASPTIMSSPFSGHLPPQDLYLLNQYIQEALAREQLLETKLAILQRLVSQTEAASGEAWKALIDEDRLLTRVEILESQLTTYSKNMTEDKLRDEVQRLMDEKEEYQEMAKETITKITDEKLGAVRKADDLVKRLGAAEDEQNLVRELYDKSSEENQRLAKEVARLSGELEEAKAAVASAASEVQAASTSTTAEPDKSVSLMAGEASSDSIATAEEATEDPQSVKESSVVEVPEAKSGEVDEAADSAEASPSTSSEVEQLRSRVSELEADNARLREERPSSEVREGSAASSAEEEAEKRAERLSQELQSALEDKMALEVEVERIRAEKDRAIANADNSSFLDMSSGSGGGGAGEAPAEASSSSGDEQTRLNHLIKVKEKYSEVTRINSELEQSLHQLEEEVEALSSQNHVATACSVVPLAVLLLAFIMAYLPSLSAVFGTTEGPAAT